jgi:hypothetical protein|tara:strand:- start:80 stop:373 length:294 start_codon:yes stop_codon:yes gene_type:complete
MIFIQQNNEHLTDHLQLIPANLDGAIEAIKDAGSEAAEATGSEWDWEERHHAWTTQHRALTGRLRIGNLVMYTEAKEKDNAWRIADAMLVAIRRVEA